MHKTNGEPVRSYDGVMEYRPSIGERILRRIGYNHTKIPEVPPVVEQSLPVWGATVAKVNLSKWDRILLLFSGCLRIEIRHQFQHDPGQVYTASEACVKWRHDERVP